MEPQVKGMDPVEEEKVLQEEEKMPCPEDYKSCLDDYDCAVCMELLAEPVTLPCNHRFC